MPGPNSFESRSEPREAVSGGWTWHEEETAKAATRCELCRSDEPTSVEYGLRVCQQCDEELLP